MRKQQLSPSASVFITLALSLGILVADLTNLRHVTVVRAQDDLGGSCTVVANATVFGDELAAVDLVVNGVTVTAAFSGSVRVVDSVICNGALRTDNGVLTGDNVTGVLTGDNVTGVLTGDGTGSSGVLTGDNLTGGGGGVVVSGGVVEGVNVQIVDGVITGGDLRVVGALVTGGSYTY